MAPSFIRHKESKRELDDEIVAVIMDEIDRQPAKPWTIVHRATGDLKNQDSDKVRATLRELTLRGKVTPTVDGDLRKARIEPSHR